MSFNSLGLSAELLRAVSDEGYTTPTPVQAEAIPAILAGRDVLAGAQTGTGKTAAFTLPLLQRLASKPIENKRRAVRALILTPTRELAAQVRDSVVTYGKNMQFKSAVIFGGVNINPQIDKLRIGVDIVVATPGRLLDHLHQRTIDLSKVEFLILDEADRMLDMGFIHDIKKVLAVLPKNRQNLLFSATFADDIRKLADSLLNNPVAVQVARKNTAAETVKQIVHPVDRVRKRELVSHLIKSQDWKQVLIFMRTKHGANRLVEQLGTDKINAVAIHGNKSQAARTKALADFKKGSVRVLVATDIAARGLDIDQLPHVVNFELPNVPEDYVHRIGRTGRAGNGGEAVSLVCIDEHAYLKDIEKLLKKNIPSEVISGFEPNPSIKAQPILNGRNNQSRGPRPTQRIGQGRPAPKHKSDSRGRGRSGGGRYSDQSNERSAGNSSGQERGQYSGRSRNDNQGSSESSNSSRGNSWGNSERSQSPSRWGSGSRQGGYGSRRPSGGRSEAR